MTDRTVYRATQPGLVKEALAEYRAELDETLAAQASFRASVDPDRSRGPAGYRRASGGAVLTGLTHSPDWPIPSGWRAVDEGARIVPDRRTKAGRKAHAVLESLAVKPQAAVLRDRFGMPDDCLKLDLGRMFVPHVSEIGDDVYVVWDVDPDDPAPSAEWWERVPLPAYYAAVETGGPAEAATAGGAR